MLSGTARQRPRVRQLQQAKCRSCRDPWRRRRTAGPCASVQEMPRIREKEERGRTVRPQGSSPRLLLSCSHPPLRFSFPHSFRPDVARVQATVERGAPTACGLGARRQSRESRARPGGLIGEGEEWWREGARGRKAARRNLGRWFVSPPLSLGLRHCIFCRGSVWVTLAHTPRVTQILRSTSG